MQMSTLDSASAPATHGTGWLLCMAPFLTQFDLTALAAAGPAMSEGLGLDLPGFARVMDAYSILFTASLLGAGHWVDRAGARRALLMGNAIFSLASLACGLAPDVALLWLGRALQGVGAALMVTAALAFVPRLFADASERTRIFTRWGLLSGVAMALGPTVGAAVAHSAGWRWVFLVNVPVGFVLAVLLRRLPHDLAVNSNANEWGPAGTSIGGLVLFSMWLVCVIEALLHLPSGSDVVAAWAGLAALVSLALAWLRSRGTMPIFAPGMLRELAVRPLAVLLAAMSLSYWTALLYLPTTLGANFGLGPAEVGAAMLLPTIPFLVVPLLAPRLVQHWGWRRFFALGMATLSLGLAMMMLGLLVGLLSGLFPQPHPAVARSSFGVGMLFMGVGAALCHPQLSGALVALVPKAHAGSASSLTILLRQGAYAIGIALFGALLGAQPGPTAFVAVHAAAAVAAFLGVVAAWGLGRR